MVICFSSLFLNLLLGKFFEQRLTGGVDLLEFLIPFFIQGGEFRVRLNGTADMDQGIGGLLHGRIFTAADHGQQRTAVTGSLFGNQDIQGNAQHVGHDGTPQRALGTAAADVGPGDLHADGAGGFHRIPDGKCHAFQYCLCDICTRRVHAQPDEGTSGIGVVDRAALAHQVGQKKHLIAAQLVPGNGGLLGGIVFISDLENVIHPPLVAGGSGEHAAHQMPAAVCVSEGMQTIGGIHAELFTADKHSAGSTQTDVAVPFPYRAGAHSCGCVISRTRTDLYTFGQTQGGGCVRFQGTNKLPAFIEMGQPFFLDTADFAHFLAPAFVFYIQEQHAGSIGIIGGVHAGHAVHQVILGQHDLGNSRIKFRLVLLHPQDLGGGESCESDVAGVFAQGLAADFLV